MDVGFEEKENGEIKYCVQLPESDVILKDVLSNELKYVFLLISVWLSP